jgi:Bacterial Ig-like domain (group 1)
MKLKNKTQTIGNLPRIALLACVFGATLALQACGGNGAGAAGSASGSALSPKAKTVVLLTSQPNLPTDGKTKATITVLVKDEGNRALANSIVDLTTTDLGATLQQTEKKTGADGSVTAVLSLSSKINRIVPIKATVDQGTLVANIDIPVTGTTVAVNGPQSLGFNGLGDFSLAVKDSAGNAVPSTDVVLKSSAGNTITPATVKTDQNGQAKFQVNVTKNGTDTISAAAAGVTSSASLSVAATQLLLTGVSNGEEVIVNSVKNVGILMTNNGAPVGGRTLRLTATRGTVTVGSGGSTVTTDPNGIASFTISSPNAGQSTISVTDAGGGGGALASIEFVSKTPGVIKLQAGKPVLGANAIGSSGNTSDLVANVRDSFGNPVKGIVVDFSAVNDPSNGRIDPPSATTDIAGNASVAFIAGPTVTGPDQVLLKATVAGSSSIASTANLTVASRQVSIRIGTGNTIADELTRYKFPWNAVVVDSSGAPIENAIVTVQVVPVGYFKGTWRQTDLFGWSAIAYETDLNGDEVFVGGLRRELVPAYCPSEDSIRQDGTLQVGEDVNNNRKLDPGNVATSDVDPAGKATSASGFVDFNILYAKSFAEFARVRIDIRARVDGTESLVSETFTLPISNADAKSPSPPVIPGQGGPFGRIVSNQVTAGGLPITANGLPVSASNPAVTVANPLTACTNPR